MTLFRIGGTRSGHFRGSATPYLLFYARVDDE